MCVSPSPALTREGGPLFFARMWRKERIIFSCSAFFWALAAVGPLAAKVSDGQIQGEFFKLDPP